MRERVTIGVREEDHSEPMRELLQTERIYVEDVKRCIDVYMEAMERMEAEGQVRECVKRGECSLHQTYSLVHRMAIRECK